MKKRFRATLYRDPAGLLCFIPVPFDPKPLFGKVQAPVVVTLRGYTYRSTILAMRDGRCVPLRREHREAAGVDDGQTVQVTLALDTASRKVTPPRDLARALRAAPPAWQRWTELSPSHQREYAGAVEQARRPETRQRRIAAAVEALRARPPRKRKAPARKRRA